MNDRTGSNIALVKRLFSGEYQRFKQQLAQHNKWQHSFQYKTAEKSSFIVVFS